MDLRLFDCPKCGWISPTNTQKGFNVHKNSCKGRLQVKQSKRKLYDVDLGDDDGGSGDDFPLHKTPRISPQPERSPEPPMPSPTPEPELVQQPSKRKRRFPAHYGNVIATSYTPNADVPMAEEALFEERLMPSEAQETAALSTPDLTNPSPLHSNPNRFHVYKVHTEQPMPSPEDIVRPPTPHPFKNDSIFNMITHVCLSPSSHTNTGSDMLGLSIADKRIKAEEMEGFSTERELKRLDAYGQTTLVAGGPWKSGSVKIKMPRTGTCFATEKEAPDFEVHDIRYRSLVDLITSRVQDPSTSKPLKGTPFTEWWSPPGSSKPIRIYGEAHSSDVAVRFYEEIKGIPPPPDQPDIQSVVVLLMLGSDSTHLASFGTASLWPVYVFFGNDSKYDTSKQSAFPAYHLAYFTKLPDTFNDAYKQAFGIPPPADVRTHCERELTHAIIELILQGDFQKAYTEGIVIEFPDGIKRRVFPRFFSYTADYPEKITIATIKSFGLYPCPRCHITKAQIRGLGKASDDTLRESTRRPTRRLLNNVKRARRSIFEKGSAVAGTAVEWLLEDMSRVAVNNAFMKCLPGINVYALLTVDVLHEIELGVWKSLFTHILRIIQASPHSHNELDKRLRSVPKFGKDTIRRFTSKTSQMKKIAAHDFEDLLQCILPALDGLLPAEQGSGILDLIFVMGCWHSYAKLRLHTEDTLTSFEQITVHLGVLLRQFATECRSIKTVELPRERQARMRNSAKKGKPTGGAKLKEFSLSTFKLHALGHYPRTIRERGTTDNYSTQWVEATHRTAKRHYANTNKHDAQRDISKRTRRVEVMAYLNRVHSSVLEAESSGYEPGEVFNMAKSTKDGVGLTGFVAPQRGKAIDPAKVNFIKMLKNYAVRWTTIPNPAIMSYDDYTDEDRSHVTIVKNMLYRHKKLNIRYITYDMQEGEDRIYPKDHPGIMVLSPDRGHPYLYARVLDLFHIEVRNDAEDSRFGKDEKVHLEMVWVHWYKYDQQQEPSGFHSLRYPTISLCEDSHPDSYGLVHPDEIVRCVHLIPDFVSASAVDSYKRVQVNILVDRDMFMRIRGGGVGHLYMRDIEQQLNESGWGTSWPSLEHRDPEPDVGNIVLNVEQESEEGDGDDEDSDGYKEDLGDLQDDADGRDPERFVDDDEEEEEGEEGEEGEEDVDSDNEHKERGSDEEEEGGGEEEEEEGEEGEGEGEDDEQGEGEEEEGGDLDGDEEDWSSVEAEKG